MKAYNVYITETITLTRVVTVQIPDDCDGGYAERQVGKLLGGKKGFREYEGADIFAATQLGGSTHRRRMVAITATRRRAADGQNLPEL
jgi:hypothetical protein